MNDKHIAKIRKEFHRSPEARYIHRLHGVLLVLSGMTCSQAGKLLNDPRRSVSDWVSAFKKHGINGLQDAERSGRPTVLNTTQQRALQVALKKTPRENGLDGETWSGARVAEFVKNRYHIQMTMRHCRRILRVAEKRNVVWKI
jgi:transposase